MVRLLLVLAVSSLLGVGLPSAVGPAAAQTASRDLAEATATAAELLRLASDRSFNALYDRIHPDAQAVVPRAAAVGAFEDIYAQAQAGRAEIVGADLVTWTWLVTGQRYPLAAAIDFVLPYVDASGREQRLDDTMYLVDSGGEWRWFFGSSADFVEATIARYGQRGVPLTEGDILVNTVNDLDLFYRDVLGYTDFAYRSPGVVLVEQGDAVQTACGPAETGFWAFYCPPNQTIYLDEPLLVQLEERYDFATAFVIGHEWAHHAQTSASFDRAAPGERPDEWNEVHSIELELMADCMTGAWALDVDTRGLLEPDDVDEAIQFSVDYLGDPEFVDEYDPQAHGTDDQRVQAFLNGYERGFLGCNVTL